MKNWILAGAPFQLQKKFVFIAVSYQMNNNGFRRVTVGAIFKQMCQNV